VVPALLLALSLPLQYAAGTSLVVITLTSAAALVARVGTDSPAPDWGLVLALTGAAVAGALAGTRIAARTDTRRLAAAFTALVLAVAAYTAVRALPALV
jgi:uncharacterized membrane protein YfcA